MCKSKWLEIFVDRKSGVLHPMQSSKESMNKQEKLNSIVPNTKNVIDKNIKIGILYENDFVFYYLYR